MRGSKSLYRSHGPANVGRSRPSVVLAVAGVLYNALDDLIAHSFKLGLFFRYQNLALVLADVFQLLDRIDKITELADGHVLVRDAVIGHTDGLGNIRHNSASLKQCQELC